MINKSFWIVLKSDNVTIYILFVKLKYELKTIIFVGVIYSMRDLLSDLNNYGDMRQIQ